MTTFHFEKRYCIFSFYGRFYVIFVGSVIHFNFFQKTFFFLKIDREFRFFPKKSIFNHGNGNQIGES